MPLSVRSGQHRRLLTLRPLPLDSTPPPPLHHRPEEVRNLRVKIPEGISAMGPIVPGGVSDNRWNDKMVLIPGYTLTYQNDTNLLPVCKEVLKSLVVGISERDVANLMLLAWNLRSPTVAGINVMGNEEDSFQQVAGDIPIANVPNRLQFTGKEFSADVIRIGNDEELVKVTCYLCASLLRLFSKEVDSYMLAYKRHLKESYCKFYTTTFPIPNYVPNKEVLKGLSQMFQALSRCRGTLGRFLYNYEVLPRDKELCAMLFEQHVGLTGMHAMVLFLRVAAGLKINGKQLVAVCWHRQTKTALLTISEMFENYIKDAQSKEEQKRQTWRYARLFGARYFSAIQTKNCTALVCTLAMICELLDQAGNRNILDIASLRSLPAESKEQYKRWATRIFLHFTSSEEENAITPYVDKYNMSSKDINMFALGWRAKSDAQLVQMSKNSHALEETLKSMTSLMSSFRTLHASFTGDLKPLLTDLPKMAEAIKEIKDAIPKKTLKKTPAVKPTQATELSV